MQYATGSQDPDVQAIAQLCNEIMAIVEAKPKPPSIKPCDCECSRGGFCGGCGHAGCLRRLSPR